MGKMLAALWQGDAEPNDCGDCIVFADTTLAGSPLSTTLWLLLAGVVGMASVTRRTGNS
jgi:hypothetical protein